MLSGFCNLGGRRTAIFSAISAALFLAIASAISVGVTQVIDQNALESLRRHALPWLTEAMRGVTYLGSWPVVALGILIFAYLNRHYPHRGTYFLIVACVGAGILSLVLKLAFQRARPTIVPGLVTAVSYSFPSGHALMSLTFYGSVAYLISCRTASWWRAWLVRLAAVFVIALIGFSRLYLGVHYITDVVAGYLTAVFWVTLLALSRAWIHWPGDLPSTTQG